LNEENCVSMVGYKDIPGRNRESMEEMGYPDTWQE
jgi:hypothetical protein